MNSAYLNMLACMRCERTVAEEDAFDGCPRCAAQGVPVNVLPLYDLGRVAGVAPAPGAAGLFGHAALLPVDPARRPVSLGEGDTPLVRQWRLGERIGLPRLYVKNESANPTWSYKDRLAAVAVTRAQQAGADTVVVSTSGNHGAAVAAYAAAAGLRCVALTTTSVPEVMRTLMQSYGADVVALPDSGARWTLMRQAVREHGWTPMSNHHAPPIGSNPFGVDGYKTIAYEIARDLGRAPDVVVVPAAYGDGLTGITRGFADLLGLGVITALPRMVAVEPLGSYADALRRRLATPGRMPAGPSLAFSTASPQGTYQGLESIRRTGGTAIAVADGETLEAVNTLARHEGLYMEAAAATGITALAGLVRDGVVGRDETAVLIMTSTGLKNAPAATAALPAVPIIEPDLGSLDRALRAGRGAGSPSHGGSR
ncbi:threonine synthase [Nonomuraea rhizosphaerae]|uniref:threonine synthase n=1 Tax=Nonomuraea rhizosphaerae TaxID=2665663 RepID=UPI001C5E46B4|nr:pyridoxal-phosphate dependent enzyme [Nonomuraea rhizosphaerae]